MTGSAQEQVGLAHAFATYQSAQSLATTLDNVWLQIAADRAHAELLLAAMRAGFRPATDHKHVLVTDWAKLRVAVIQRIMPNHLAEAGRAA